MAGHRDRRNILQTLNDSENIDHVRIMFAVDPIRDVLTSATQCSNIERPETKI